MLEKFHGLATLYYLLPFNEKVTWDIPPAHSENRQDTARVSERITTLGFGSCHNENIFRRDVERAQ